MIETAQALYEFWNGFGIPAYVEETVPDDAQLPYITYRLGKPDPMHQMAYYARIWYEGTSFREVLEKATEIEQAIGGGMSIPLSYGCLVLYREDEFIQMEPTEDDKMKVVYLNMILEVHK